jgi:hypothetical protein
MLSQAGGAQPAGERKEMAAKPVVIFVNASSDTQTADVFINGTKNGTVAYGKTFEGKDLAGGPAKVEFKSADKVIATWDGNLIGDKNYTVVISGKTGAVKAEQIEARFTPGKAHAFILNAMADPVDITVDGKSATTGLAMNKRFEADWEAGKHKVEVLSGSAQPITSKDIDVKADACYTLIATGAATGTPKADLIIVTHGPAKKAGTAR